MNLIDTPPRGLRAVNGAEITGRAHDLHQRANELFGLYGRSADTPRADETDTAYARRILGTAKRYSSQWSNVDFDRLPTSALPVAFKQIVDDGISSYTRSGPGTGELRQKIEVDHSGRKFIRFYGDPEYCWAPFKDPVRRLVTGWNESGYGKGADAPGATRPVGTLMSDGSMRRARRVGE